MDKQANGTVPRGPKPRTYTDEYRRQVVDMVVGSGRTATSVGAELGIHHTLISRWVRRYRRASGTGPVAPAPAAPVVSRPALVPHADQAAEIARLKREVEQLKMEREVLKKGIVIFANPSR